MMPMRMPSPAAAMPPSSPLQSAGAPTTVGHAVGVVRLREVGHRRPDAPDAGHGREAESSLRGSVTTSASMTVRMRALTRSPGAARSQPQLGGALLARERGEREARAQALEVDVPVRVAQLRQRRALGDRRSAQLDDDLGARAGRVRGRSGEGQQRTERDEQGTRWQPHASSVPLLQPFAVQPVEHVPPQAVARREARMVEIVGRDRASCRSAA